VAVTEKEIVMSKEELVMIAFNEYGKCIGSKFCKVNTVEVMMKDYSLTKEEAEEIVDAAFNEWMDAYS
jgi:hypothetical protein